MVRVYGTQRNLTILDTRKCIRYLDTVSNSNGNGYHYLDTVFDLNGNCFHYLETVSDFFPKN